MQFKITSLSILIVLLFNACAVKQEDSTAIQITKHTVNSPFYVIYGVGKVAETALIGALAGTAYVVTAGGKLTEKKDTSQLNDKKVNGEEKIDQVE